MSVGLEPCGTPVHHAMEDGAATRPGDGDGDANSAPAPAPLPAAGHRTDGDAATLSRGGEHTNFAKIEQRSNQILAVSKPAKALCCTRHL